MAEGVGAHLLDDDHRLIAAEGGAVRPAKAWPLPMCVQRAAEDAELDRLRARRDRFAVDDDLVAVVAAQRERHVRWIERVGEDPVDREQVELACRPAGSSRRAGAEQP